MKKDLNIDHSVYVDTSGVFARLNPHIPNKGMFHMFMIDRDDSVVLVGDPARNKKVRELIQDQNMCGTPVRAVIDSGRKPQVEYILGKSGIGTDSDSLLFVENADSVYVRGRIENLDLSGTFMLVDEGEVKGTYLYLNSIQVEDI